MGAVRMMVGREGFAELDDLDQTVNAHTLA
jgi:hypothetical protein